MEFVKSEEDNGARSKLGCSGSDVRKKEQNGRARAGKCYPFEAGKDFVRSPKHEQQKTWGSLSINFGPTYRCLAPLRVGVLTF